MTAALSISNTPGQAMLAELKPSRAFGAGSTATAGGFEGLLTDRANRQRSTPIVPLAHSREREAGAAGAGPIGLDELIQRAQERHAFAPPNRASAAPGDVDAELWSEAREKAGELVALSFIKPILGELRESSMGWGPFQPGTWEKRLGPVLDAEVAKDIVSSSNWPLIDDLASRFVGHARIQHADISAALGTQP